MSAEVEVQNIIDRETRAWNEKSIDLLLSIFHPDMVWVWPTDSKKFDPMTWALPQGKFDRERYLKIYTAWFDQFDLIRNERKTLKITSSNENDAAFAIVDVDTLWCSSSGEESHWKGRTGKTYVKMADGWKMINQVGVFDLS